MFARRKLHLIEPASGKRKWFLSTSPMVFFFATLLFPFVTRRLWGWLTVYILFDLFMIGMVAIETTMVPDDVQATNAVLQIIAIGLAIWASTVANKRATRRFLANGWRVSSETSPLAWAYFQTAWKLPESAYLESKLATV